MGSLPYVGILPITLMHALLNCWVESLKGLGVMFKPKLAKQKATSIKNYQKGPTKWKAYGLPTLDKYLRWKANGQKACNTAMFWRKFLHLFKGFSRWWPPPWSKRLAKICSCILRQIAGRLPRQNTTSSRTDVLPYDACFNRSNSSHAKLQRVSLWIADGG